MIKLIITLCLVLTAFNSNATRYWADWYSTNDCQTGGTYLATCDYKATPLEACQTLGQIRGSLGNIDASQLPFSYNGSYCTNAIGHTLDPVNSVDEAVLCSAIGLFCEGSGEVENCIDGFEPDLLGYPGCDRPDLQQCAGGTMILASENCPVLGAACDTEYLDNLEAFCSGYDTSTGYVCAVTDGVIQGHCTFPDPTDNPDLPFDPALPPDDNTSADGITMISNTTEIAQKIDQLLSADFQALLLETGKVKSEVQQLNHDLVLKLTELVQGNENAIDNLLEELRKSSDKNTEGLDGVIAGLTALGQDGDSIGHCDPTNSNYLTCLVQCLSPDSPLADTVFCTSKVIQIPSYFGDKTFTTVNANFLNDVKGTDLGAFLIDFNSNVNIESPECPVFGVHLPYPFNEDISSDLHCNIYNDIKGPISAAFTFIWLLLGFRIIASA